MAVSQPCTPRPPVQSSLHLQSQVPSSVQWGRARSPGVGRTHWHCLRTEPRRASGTRSVMEKQWSPQHHCFSRCSRRVAVARAGRARGEERGPRERATPRCSNAGCLVCLSRPASPASVSSLVQGGPSSNLPPLSSHGGNGTLAVTALVLRQERSVGLEEMTMVLLSQVQP